MCRGNTQLASANDRQTHTMSKPGPSDRAPERSLDDSSDSGTDDDSDCRPVKGDFWSRMENDWRRCAVAVAGDEDRLAYQVSLPEDSLTEGSGSESEESETVTGSIDEELLSQIPLDEHGKLLSLGSVGHTEGTCKAPCVFAQKKKGCKNGHLCNFCHYDHKLAKRSSQKKKSKARQARAARAAQKLEVGATPGHQEAISAGDHPSSSSSAAVAFPPEVNVPAMVASTETWPPATGPLLILSSCPAAQLPPGPHPPKDPDSSSHGFCQPPRANSRNGDASMRGRPNL